MIYLMFSWGYLPRRGDVLFREDVCREAIRLSESLLAQTDGQTAGHHALHALLLFQTARFPARTGPEGNLLTLEQQDRTKWDQEMIFDGFAQLQAAQSSPSLTRYHLEAGIASAHAQARTWQGTDWAAIVQLYTLLNQQAPSLAVSVNLAVSFIYAGEISRAQTQLDEAATLAAAQDLPGYHLARAKLAHARNGDGSEAQAALKRAAACRISAPIYDHIARQAALIDIEP